MVLNPSGFDTRALLNPPSISPGQRRSIIHPSFLNTLNTTDRDWERRATMPHSTMQIEPPQETSNWRQYDGTANEITSQDSLYYASGRLWENTQRDYQMQ